MRRHTDLLEHRQVLLDAGTFRVDALGADTRLEFNRVMNSLTTGEHLLATEEHIEGICNTNTISHRSTGIVKLGIEWPRRLRELVNDVKVRLVLGADHLAKSLLLGSAHIFIIAYICKLGGSFLSQKLLRLGKGKADFFAWLGKEERLHRVDGSDCLNFVRTSLCIGSKPVRACAQTSF